MNNYLEANEIKKVLLKNKKLILIIAVVFGLFLGGYKAASIFLAAEETVSETSIDETTLTYEEQLKNYDDQKQGYQNTIGILEQELASANTTVLENPIMELNPYDCEFTTVIVAFSNDKGSKVKSVYSWIQSADPKELFNSDDKILARYKSNIINVLQSNYESEVEIQIYDTKACDSQLIAKNVEKVIRENAEKSGQTINNLTIFHQHASSSSLYDTQGYFRGNVSRVNSDLKSVKETYRNLQVPVEDKTASKRSKAIRIIKFFVLGIVLGLLFGIIAVLYKIIGGGYILSGSQMEIIFGLDSIGEYSAGNDNSKDILAANLKALSPDTQSLMLLNNHFDERDKQFAGEMESACNKRITPGTNITEDVETISSLNSVDGVIIGVASGKTRLEEVQRSIARLNKLNKDIIGYVIFK